MKKRETVGPGKGEKEKRRGTLLSNLDPAVARIQAQMI